MSVLCALTDYSQRSSALQVSEVDWANQEAAKSTRMFEASCPFNHSYRDGVVPLRRAHAVRLVSESWDRKAL